MKVVLLENLRKLGSIGEIINVKRGYARNFLIPQKKALFASDKNIKEVEKIMERRKRRAESKYLPDPIEWLEGVEEEISEELEKKYDIT